MRHRNPKKSYGHGGNDSIGNRKLAKETQVPHDGIGNQLPPTSFNRQISDQIGNSIDTPPTHHLSSSYRKKNASSAPAQRSGRHIVGGVNPIISGMNPPAAEQSDSGSGSQSSVSNSQQEKRLKRLLGFDEDDRIEYTLTSTPEQKKAQAEETIKTIFEKGNMPVEILASLEELDSKPSLTLQVKAPKFQPTDLSLAALNFLTNKIVNKIPNDRIKLSIKAAPETNST